MDEITLSILLAAEEHHSTASPDAVEQEVRQATGELSEVVLTRMRLRRQVGIDEARDGARDVCTAVSTTLFGAGGPDDRENDGLFRGAADDYYNPANSMIDRVLERRSGIPISLSLVYTATAREVSASLSNGWDGELVGLNAPGHLLLAPAADVTDFVVDPFVGALLETDGQLSDFVGDRLPPDFPVQQRESFVAGLRARPMHRFDWIARSLRNLRRIYSAQYDVVRLLGAAERTLLVADANQRDAATGARPAVPSRERLECEREVATCLYLLGDDERATEARGLLLSCLSGHTWDANFRPDEREALERLLEDDFFKLR